jgi:hypothetical protein
MTTTRVIEAKGIWDWIQWKLPPEVWLEAQDVLHSQTQPNPTDPQLASGLAELLNPATTTARRKTLIRQLLLIIRDG